MVQSTTQKDETATTIEGKGIDIERIFDGHSSSSSSASSPAPTMTAVVRHATAQDLQEHAAAWRKQRTKNGDFENETHPYKDEESLMDLHPKPRRILALFALLCFLVALGALVTVAIAFLKEDGQQSNNGYKKEDEINGVPIGTTNTTIVVNISKRNTYFEELHEVLPLNGSHDANAHISNYHQLLAIKWLAYKDNLFLPSTSQELFQRFTLLTIIFDLEDVISIDKWNETNPNVHHCHEEWWISSSSLAVTPSFSTQPIRCDDDTNRIVKEFHSQDLTHPGGTIPKEIGLLTTLTTLNLGTNEMKGSVPEQLWDLSNLVRLHLQNNGISSTLSTEIGRLSNLEVFDISSNSFIGKIPTELASLTSIRTFNINGNEIEGPLFEIISPYWTSIEHIFVENTMVNGIIPPSIGNLQKLTSLVIRNNSMKGSLPNEVGKLANLEYLRLEKISFTGTIPADIGYCSQIIFFVIGQTELTGNLPTNLGRLTNLRYFSISDNRVVGNIPSELGKIGSLGFLELINTPITGTIPSDVANNAGLSSISLYGTELSGTVPKNICKLRQDQLIDLRIDCLTKVSCEPGCCTSCF